MLDVSRLIWTPGVALIGNTVMINQGLEEAIELSGTTDIAEIDGSPLNNLIARALDGGADGDNLAEFAGRQCYRSWKTGRPNDEYIANVKEMGHGSVFEHASVVFQVTGVSRALTHELIRHRVGTAYSQESQRYVDAKDMFFVVPPLLCNSVVAQLGQPLLGHAYNATELDNLTGLTKAALDVFRRSCQRALEGYRDMQPILVELAKAVERATLEGDEKAATSAKKRANEAARSVLPNASETRLVFTVNLRQFQHVLTLRGAEGADLEIRRLVVALLDNSRNYAPNFFRDVKLVIGDDGIEALRSEVIKL